MIERKERLALRNKVQSDEHLELYGRLSLGIGTKTWLHCPLDFAKTLKLPSRAGDLDLPKRSRRYPSSRKRRP